MMTIEIIARKLDLIQTQIEEQNLQQKEFLTLKETARFLDISESTLYKKTSKREIPFTSPSNGKIYFLKVDLIDYLKSNRVTSNDETEKKAINYTLNSKAN